MRRKIAVVVQRYGLEVNGGSELYARQIAELLEKSNDVEVLTTCAVDYTTWENHFPEGEELINGVKVRRFRVAHARDESVFPALDRKMKIQPDAGEELSDAWIENLGPYSPGLVEYAVSHEKDYDLFFVVTYTYYPAFRIMRLIGEKAVFIPTAHKEDYFYYSLYEQGFHNAAGFVFLTEEERALVCTRYPDAAQKPQIVAGVGVSIPKKKMEKPLRGKGIRKNTPYLIYVGRIDPGKDCPRLFTYFREYKRRNPGDLKLVLMGKAIISIPRDRSIISLGFVPEEMKFSGVKNAVALILPSRYESLSISVLEAFAVGTPVIVNGNCEVLKGHCVRSNAGLYYRDYLEFEGIVNRFLNDKDMTAKMAENAEKYIADNYTWDLIEKKFSSIIEQVIEHRGGT